MAARSPRRRLLKPHPVAWTAENELKPPVPALELFHTASEAPAPARLQMPAPGSTAVAVMLAVSEDLTDPLDVPDRPEEPEEEETLAPTEKLTLVPSLGFRLPEAPGTVPVEAAAATEDEEEDSIKTWLHDAPPMLATLARHGSGAESDDDARLSDFMPGGPSSSLGDRLFRRLPPVRGLTRVESLLLGMLGAAAPLVIVGVLLLGWSLSRALGDDPPPPPAPVPVAGPAPVAAVTSQPAPEPEVSAEATEIPAEDPPAAPEPEPVPVAAPGGRRGGNKVEPKAAALPPAPASPIDPWAQPPAVVPNAAPTEGGAPPSGDTKATKKKGR